MERLPYPNLMASARFAPPLELARVCQQIPVSEQHLHIEGTLAPWMMVKLAQRNQIALHYRSHQELKKAYRFGNLDDFLALYYVGCKVLVTELDFYELTMAYLVRAARQNVRHAEMFFDPQTHLANGVAFATVVNGIERARVEAREKLGISSLLIMCFLRHLPAEEAMAVLEQSLAFRDKIVGVGLDSSERQYPPRLFEAVFTKARQCGYRVVAHAGEEGPADYVWQALEMLKVERVDHGLRAIDDPRLIEYLASRQVPLTMCPFSNKRLKAISSLRDYPLRYLLGHNVCALVNSDDPAYFGGYVKRNLLGVARAQKLSLDDIFKLARNSFRASFLADPEKARLLAEVDQFEHSLEADR